MILCLGTTPTAQRTMVFETLKSNDVNRAKSVREFASGKAINVARVLQSLGEPALVTGFVGGDRGAFLRRDLDAGRIRHDFVTVAAATRLCTTVVDRATGTAIELVEESRSVEPTDWPRLNEKFEQISQGCGVWVFSGSLPPNAPQDFYARWVPLARQRNVKLILDARGEPLRLAMKHPGFIVKVNREELAATVGMELATEGALKEAMRATTPEGGAIVVTAGKDGSWAYDGARFCHVSLAAIQVVNPIGSGDSYAAGLAAGLRRGLPFMDACRLGSACGSANALTQDAGHVALTDVENLFQQTSVRDLTI
jgi:tagatose 6-phosphate kinase